jgi:hypothetical protein
VGQHNRKDLGQCRADASAHAMSQVTAAQASQTQRKIGEALNVSQPAVAQMLARARRWPQQWQRTPRKVAREYAAGQFTREQMPREFRAWPPDVGPTSVCPTRRLS